MNNADESRWERAIAACALLGNPPSNCGICTGVSHVACLFFSTLPSVLPSVITTSARLFNLFHSVIVFQRYYFQQGQLWWQATIAYTCLNNKQQANAGGSFLAYRCNRSQSTQGHGETDTRGSPAASLCWHTFWAIRALICFAVRSWQAKISSGKSWLFLGMAESLLKSDREVRFVMAVSLFPVSLPKTGQRKWRQNNVSNLKRLRSHTFSAGWKHIQESHHGFETFVSFVLQIYSKSQHRFSFCFATAVFRVNV